MIELLKNRSVISVTGADALKFLQSMTTNDLENHQNSYNYLLSPQGKYLHDFFVSKVSDEELLIDIDYSCVGAFIQKLNLYKLRRAVQLEDLSDDYCVVYSPLSALPTKAGIPEYKVHYQDPRFHKLGFRSIIKTSYINNSELVSNNLYKQDKYEFAIPDGVSDLIFDRSIPLHFGGEELLAISFSKGCYVGQEVISRAKYQGVIRKKIFKIKSDLQISFHEIGAEITDINGGKIGIFCSSYNNVGIVLLDEEKYLELDKKIAIIEEGDKVEIIVPEWRE